MIERTMTALLETLKGRDVRLVRASSSSEYGLNDNMRERRGLLSYELRLS